MDLVHQLTHNADRTFLWVSLILEMIEESAKVSKRALEEIVRTIPPTLDTVYHRILEQSSNADDARKILHTVVGAVRPLSLDEMNVAFCINSSAEEELDLEPCMANTLKAVRRLFLRIRDDKIYLVHQTAKEFLVSSSSDAATALERKDTSAYSSNDHPINI